MIVRGCRRPVEKARDDSLRNIVQSAAPYCLSQETLDSILGVDRDEKNNYLI